CQRGGTATSQPRRPGRVTARTRQPRPSACEKAWFVDTIRVSDGNSQNTRPVRRVATANEPRPRPDERGPLSYAPRRLWCLERWLGDSPAYNVPVTLCFSGPLDAGRLVAALTSVVARHDVVFTVFEEEGGEPRQRLLGGREPDCPLVDLTAGDLAGLDLAERRARAGALIGADARRPFDLSAGPMLRTALYRLAED